MKERQFSLLLGNMYLIASWFFLGENWITWGLLIGISLVWTLTSIIKSDDKW